MTGSTTFDAVTFDDVDWGNQRSLQKNHMFYNKTSKFSGSKVSGRVGLNAWSLTVDFQHFQHLA